MSYNFSNVSSSSGTYYDDSSSSSAAGINIPQLVVEVLGFVPSSGICIVGMIGFAVFGVLLLYQSILCWRHTYTIWLPLAAVGEFFGYYCRDIIISNPQIYNFILAIMLPLVIPNLLALVNYSTLSRMVRLIPVEPDTVTSCRVPYFTDATGRLQPGRIAVFFVFADITTFAIQIAATIMLGSSDLEQAAQGKKMIIAGLILAIAFIICFALITLYVNCSSRYSVAQHPCYGTFQIMFRSLYITMFLLLLRSLYRLVEYTSDIKSEIDLFIFDTCVVWIAMFFYWWYPFGFALARIEEHNTLSVNQCGNDRVSIIILPNTGRLTEMKTSVAYDEGDDLLKQTSSYH